MNWREMNEAVRDAKKTVELSNSAIRQTAHLLCWNLKTSNVGHRVLCDLKNELRKYNLQTWTWKE